MEPFYKKSYFTTLAFENYISVLKDFPEVNFLILDAFYHLSNEQKAKIYAFVLMRDHIHFVWEINEKYTVEQLITSFKKHTGKEITNYLKKVNPNYLDYFLSNRKDRAYKIWKQTKGNIRIVNKEMLTGRIKYIHDNPTRGNYKTVDFPEDYYFSSAQAYVAQESNFRFLTVIEGIRVWC